MTIETERNQEYADLIEEITMIDWEALEEI